MLDEKVTLTWKPEPSYMCATCTCCIFYRPSFVGSLMASVRTMIRTQLLPWVASPDLGVRVQAQAEPL